MRGHGNIVRRTGPRVEGTNGSLRHESFGKSPHFWLNRAVRRRIKYGRPGKRRRSRKLFLWLQGLLVLVGLSVAGWIWWQAREISPPAPIQKTIPTPPT